MPPQNIAMFHRAPGNFFRPRKQRLTQLYSDTKQSYESARVVPSSLSRHGRDTKDGLLSSNTGNVEDVDATEEDIEVLQLRKDFQMQQDRLLAWGVFWADVGAHNQNQSQQGGSGGSYGEKEKGKGTTDVEIDRKIDQAGLGDLVASVMEEIKKLLDESGRFQHPERWEEQQQQQQKQGSSPGQQTTNLTTTMVDKEKESKWKSYEVQTGRVLLQQLTGCIDVLYSLVDHNEGATKESLDLARPGSGGNTTAVYDEQHLHHHHHHHHSRQRSLPDTKYAEKLQQEQERERQQEQEQLQTQRQEPGQSPAAYFRHPLYIDFARLQPMHDPNVDESELEPPSYDDVQNTSGLQARSIYFYSDVQVYVIVDLVSTARPIPLSNGQDDQDQDDPMQSMYNLADKLSGSGLLSWDGHLKLLGFTVAGSKASSRFGLIYALPAPADPTALQQYQTLTTTIAASYDHDASMPALENKFRLAYNISLVVAGYLAHNSTHGHITASNTIFLHENSGPGSGFNRLNIKVRSPYVLQPVQRLAGLDMSYDSLHETIYKHPDADSAGYGAVAAHDVYSVGLLLLEVGMWLPLRKFWKPKYYSDRPLFAERLRKTYSPKLASKCGSRYMKAVQKCLDAPEALADKPGCMDAAEYLLDVIRELACCCIIDENEQPSGLDIEIFEAMIDEARLALPSDQDLARKMNSASQRDKALPDLPVELPVEHRTERPVSGRNVRRRRSTKQSDDKPSLRKFPNMAIPQTQLDAWNGSVMPKLQRVLGDILAGSRESASVSLMMIGPSQERAVTTIVVQCCESHTAKVHEELKVRLKGKIKLGRGWGLVVLKGEVRRSTRGRTTVKSGTVRRSLFDERSYGKDVAQQKSKQREYQKRPSSGASIGAFKDGEHLPPVTLGGTILLDGEAYGMSVHHMLDDVSDRGSDDEDMSDSEGDETNDDVIPQRSTMTRTAAHTELQGMGSHIQLRGSLSESHDLDFPDEGFAEEEFDYESESETSTIRPDFSTFDDDGNECWFMDDDSSLPDLDDDLSSESSVDSDDEDAKSVGDRPGYDRYKTSLHDDDELCITQPAIDDVDDDFFPCVEDRDDDHLSSHTFGYVHASSGIRRAIKNNIKHEIDWALISVEKPRCGFTGARSMRNSKSKLKSKPSPELQLTSVSSMSSLPNSQVRSVGRTSGPATGKISQAMSLVKFHGRTSFSSSFTIEGGFGVPGDSGAWVWNEERNELCGHILAWADGLQVAFMAPMEVLFDDIKEQLGVAKVELVGAFLEMEEKTQKAKGNTASSLQTGLEGKKKVNAQLERARELEVALKNLHIDSNRGRVTRENSRDGKGHDTYGHTMGMNASQASSASSGYSRKDGCERTKKERFDIQISGGKDVKALPMARALS